MTNYARTPYVAVTVNGTAVSDVLSARVEAGYSMRVAQAEVVCRAMPAGIQPWDTVVITIGAGSATAQQRFSGFFIEPEEELFEHAIRLNCKGQLHRAAIFNAETNVDMSSSAAGSSPAGYPDEVMVSTVLYICAISGTFIPSGELHMDSINGTGRRMGQISEAHGFQWDSGSSGLAFIEKMDSVCLGYRTYDGMDGTIHRDLITTVPTGTPDWTFTEGVDVFRANRHVSVQDLRNYIKVYGWDGDKTTRAGTAWAYNPYAVPNLAPTNPDNPYRNLMQRISSPMIEYGAITGGTVGIAAQEVAEWQLGELNRRMEYITLTTPRDDLIQPGHKVQVLAPTYLGVTDRLYWVQKVDVSLARSGQFSQVLTLLGSPDGAVFPQGTATTATATAAGIAPSVTGGGALAAVTATTTADGIAPSVTGGSELGGETGTATAEGIAPEISEV